MNAETTVAIVNTAIVIAITTITILGFVLIHTADGLWSMLLVFAFMSTKREKTDGNTDQT